MPLVDGRIVLNARVRAGPRGFGRLTPHVLGVVRVANLAGCAHDRLPFAAGLNGLHELVCHANRVVRILAGDGPVGLAVEVAREARGDERVGLFSSRTFQLMKSRISG